MNAFYGREHMNVKKSSWSSDFFILKTGESALTAFKRDAAFWTVCERSTICQKNVHEGGSFSVKMVYKRVMGWTLGRSLPVENFVE